MPNIAPNGVWGRGRTTPGAPTPMIEGVATLPGETNARQVIEVWAGAADGTPVIVWSLTAGSPTSATASYAPTAVTVEWVPATPLIADSYNVRRPDGSLAGNVPAGVTSFVDENPRPLSGPYRVYGVLAGAQSSVGTATNSLDLQMQPVDLTGVVVDPGTLGQTVTLTWSQPTVGRPDNWRLYRDGALVGTYAGTATTLTGQYAPPGAEVSYELRAVLSGVESAQPAVIVVGVPPRPPTAVSLTATTAPLSNLRLQWDHAAGGRDGYEVERLVQSVGPPWIAHESLPAAATVSDWSTEESGYMRIRSFVTGIGYSEWVQAGPVTPINDITPPINAVITSWQPEASYGRLVVRGTNSSSPDTNRLAIYYRVGAGPWVMSVNTGATPGGSFGLAVGTFAAGQTVTVRVANRDTAGNWNTGPTSTYTLAASPIIIDPSGDRSGTWRVDEWRNDGVRSTLEVATGWTSSGRNVGCFFYGTTIAAALAGKSVVSGTVEYYRENEGGLSAGVQPLFWTHNLTGRTGEPALSAQGVAESSRLGSAVARTGTTGGTFNLPGAFLNALKAGTARGLAMYRSEIGSGDPDNFYALLGIGDATGGSPAKVGGRLRINHLG